MISENVAGSGDEMEIRLPDEGSSNNKQSSKSGSDLTTRLSEMNYDSFQTPSKDQFSISEVLTRMAQGEQVDVDGFISGDMKRRRLSGGGYDPSTGGMFDTPQPRVKDPWSESTPVKEPVPDLLSWVRRLRHEELCCFNIILYFRRMMIKWRTLPWLG